MSQITSPHPGERPREPAGGIRLAGYIHERAIECQVAGLEPEVEARVNEPWHNEREQAYRPDPPATAGPVERNRRQARRGLRRCEFHESAHRATDGENRKRCRMMIRARFSSDKKPGS